MADPRPTVLDLFSGYGGWPLALQHAGLRPDVLAYVEWDSYAAAVLLARMGEARLPAAPVWCGDVGQFDAAGLAGLVDIVCAGFPCQPFSSAGQRRGVDDDRWLWPEIARIVGEVGPGIVILENVPGVVRHGLPEVCADLADLGFDAEWGLYSAAAVGAPHRRERFWLLAYADRDELAQFGWQPDDDRHPRHDADRSGGTHVADAAGIRRDEGQRPATRNRRTVTASGHRGFPPHPDDHDGWREWIAAGGPEPQLRRSPDGATGRLVRPSGLADRLHLLGNGLVPQCASEAIRQLARRALT